MTHDRRLTTPEDRLDREDDPGGAVQMGLFSADVMEAEAAFAALGRRDFDRAEGMFRAIVGRDATSRDGRDGLAAVEYWRPVVARSEGVGPVERAVELWRAVEACPEHLLPRSLRRSLLEEMLELLETRAEALPAFEVCVGDVLLALGREQMARSWLEWAIRHERDAARLHLLLGDAHWLTEAPSRARSCYSRGLLLDPTLDRWRSVAWPELASRIRAVGTPRAALELWVEGVIPVPPTDTSGVAHPEVVETWQALAGAEEAAIRNRHVDLLRHRARLRELDRGLFEAYMARLEGGVDPSAPPSGGLL